jgi:hypothetical protein
MIRQYDLLNRCLRELKGSQVPETKRLRLEVLLIQTKLVLLKSEVESRVAGDAASEQEFLGVYDSVKRVCVHYCQAETDQLICYLERMKEGLNDNPEAKRANVRLGQTEKARRLWTFMQNS